MSVDALCRKFKESSQGKKLNEEISETFITSHNHKDSISSSVYSLSKWTLFKTCMSREIILMRRNSFVYIFKSVQVMFIDFFVLAIHFRLNDGQEMTYKKASANTCILMKSVIHFFVILFLCSLS